ncbi:MAG: L-serine ammonia-lyase [Balneolaceae bacterium]|nr:L-serine ammonia-lyase [Balneolaceae bacterium]
MFKETSQAISVFDLFKIGIGPSSSHTLGPWKAAREFISVLREQELLQKTTKFKVELYGSLALTGKGHGTDKAICLGLFDKDPKTISKEAVSELFDEALRTHKVSVSGYEIEFHLEEDLTFFDEEALPFHPNGVTFEAVLEDDQTIRETYYSVGGGFVVQEGETEEESQNLKFPFQTAEDIAKHCSEHSLKISELAFQNELSWNDGESIRQQLLQIWEVMRSSVYNGCHTPGVLPGPLQVKRRAQTFNKRLIQDEDYQSIDEWLDTICMGDYSFSEIIKWISCFAMAVNEENADFGRIVTSPTNGSAGVIPAVLLYLLCFEDAGPDNEMIVEFLLVAGLIGILFKKGATISAAMGGCQAEIGVSSAMAAAGLTECLGGNFSQVLMAAEIAMEHHLGLTCDPIAGLVQVPCIERNTMGATKAITASKLALDSNPTDAKVSVDEVIKTMLQTAEEMNKNYKETSQGGLAVNVSVKVSEC